MLFISVLVGGCPGPNPATARGKFFPDQRTHQAPKTRNEGLLRSAPSPVLERNTHRQQLFGFWFSCVISQRFSMQFPGSSTPLSLSLSCFLSWILIWVSSQCRLWLKANKTPHGKFRSSRDATWLQARVAGQLDLVFELIYHLGASVPPAFVAIKEGLCLSSQRTWAWTFPKSPADHIASSRSRTTACTPYVCYLAQGSGQRHRLCSPKWPPLQEPGWPTASTTGRLPHRALWHTCHLTNLGSQGWPLRKLLKLSAEETFLSMGIQILDIKIW